MQIVQETEAKGPLSHQDRDGLLLGFLEDIERLNKHIAWHQSQNVADNPSIAEFTHLRDSYIEQVTLIMRHYGLDVKPLPVSLLSGKQAA